jgi:hypothetical protein
MAVSENGIAGRPEGVPRRHLILTGISMRLAP